MFELNTQGLSDWNPESFKATVFKGGLVNPEIGTVIGTGLRRHAINEDISGLHQETPQQRQKKIDAALQAWSEKNPQMPGESQEDYFGRVKDFSKAVTESQDFSGSSMRYAIPQADPNATRAVGFDTNLEPRSMETAAEGGGALYSKFTKDYGPLVMNPEYTTDVTPVQTAPVAPIAPGIMTQPAGETPESYAARKAGALRGIEEQNPVETQADYYDKLATAWLKYDTEKAMTYKAKGMELRQEQNIRDITTKGMEEAANSPDPATGYRNLAKQIARYDQGAAMDLWKAAAEYDMRKAQMNWSMRPTQDQYSQVFATMRDVKDQGQWDAERARLMKINPGVEIPSKMDPEALNTLSYRAGGNEKFSGPQTGTYQWASIINAVNAKKADDLRIVYGDVTRAPQGTYTPDEINEAKNQWVAAKNAYLESNDQLLSGKYTGGQFSSAGIQGDISAADTSPTDLDVVTTVDQGYPSINGVSRRKFIEGVTPTAKLQTLNDKNEQAYMEESKKNASRVTALIENPTTVSADATAIANSLNSILNDNTKYPTEEAKVTAVESFVGSTKSDTQKKGTIAAILSMIPYVGGKVTENRKLTLKEASEAVVQANTMAQNMRGIDLTNLANNKNRLITIANLTPMDPTHREEVIKAINKIGIAKVAAPAPKGKLKDPRVATVDNRNSAVEDLDK